MLHLTQKITRKAAEFTNDEEIALDLILTFNERHNLLLEEYANCPSIELENNILNQFEMFCIEEQYCY